MGNRDTTAGQINKAGFSDGTLTLDKVFVVVPAADSKAQTSMIMDGFRLGSRAQPNSSRNVRTAVRLARAIMRWPAAKRGPFRLFTAPDEHQTLARVQEDDCQV